MSELDAMSRLAQLQQRCEAQRASLSASVADIEHRLQSTDVALGTVRKFITKPAVLASGAALLLSAGRSGLWSKISRGVVLFATARRLYRAFRAR